MKILAVPAVLIVLAPALAVARIPARECHVGAWEKMIPPEWCEAIRDGASALHWPSEPQDSGVTECQDLLRKEIEEHKGFVAAGHVCDNILAANSDAGVMLPIPAKPAPLP